MKHTLQNTRQKTIKKKQNVIYLRPHHLLCALAFQGKGYSKNFVKNFYYVLSLLKQAHPPRIQISFHKDSICLACPIFKNNLCQNESKIVASLDQKHAQLLHLKENDTLSWKEAKIKLAKHITLKQFNKACQDCRWKPLGLCEKALKTLKKTFQKKLLIFIACIFSTISFVSKKSNAKTTLHQATQTLAHLQRTPTSSRPPFFIQGTDFLKTFSHPSYVNQPILNTASTRSFSPFFSSLSKVLTLIKKHQFSKAIQKINKIKSTEPTLSDYLSFLKAQITFKKAKKNFPKHLARSKKLLKKTLKQTLPFFAPENPSPISSLATELRIKTYRLLFQIHFLKKKWNHAQKSFITLLKLIPKKKWILSFSAEFLKKYTKSCVAAWTKTCHHWILKLRNHYPPTSKAFKSLLLKKKLTQKTFHAFPRVRRFYSLIRKDFLAFEKHRHLFYSQKDKTKVILKLKSFLKKYPQSKLIPRTLFFLARAYQTEELWYEAQTIWKQLIKRFPFSYYGILASFELGIDITKRIDVHLPLFSAQDPSLSSQEKKSFYRAQLFIQIQKQNWTKNELRSIKHYSIRKSRFLYFLAGLHTELKNYLEAFHIAGELLDRGDHAIASSFGLRIIFPIPYFLNIIKKNAKTFHIPPLLLLSLIKQESAFSKNILSHSGAMGLMQLMPQTALDLDSKLDFYKLTTVKENIFLGAKYLSKLSKTFHHTWPWILSAYNAGPGRVKKWIQTYKHLSMIDFIENIPFPETQNYVTSIFRNFYWYHHRDLPTHLLSFKKIRSFKKLFLLIKKPLK